MLSDVKWDVNGVCVTCRYRGAEGPEGVGERSEAQIGGLRTREKMKRVACRIWTTCSWSAHLVRALSPWVRRKFLTILWQTVSSTILKSALKCSRKIMIAVINEQLKGVIL